MILLKEKKKSKIDGNIEEYKHLQNKVYAMIKSAKQSKFKAKLEEVKDNQSSIWKLCRELVASNKSKSEENSVGINVDNELVASN